MKISCPKCNATGSIPDHDIPESGRFISCPRCNEGFTVTKPRHGSDVYLVDTCPACGFSTFGDETFSVCPKCGIAIKTFVERQREEQLQKRNQELLAKKFNNADTSAPITEPAETPVADFIDNLHPVNLIGWSVALVALIILCTGLWGLIEHDSSKIQAMLMEERDEPVTGFYIFLHFALIHWIKMTYGICALIISVLFLKRLRIALRAMSYLLWATIAIVPLSYIVSYIYKIMDPIPHTAAGYIIDFLNIILMGTLVGVPLFLLDRYIHDRRITSVVKL